MTYEQYLKVKDNCCLAYFGPQEEFAIQLAIIHPIIQRHMPALKISLCVRDEAMKWFENDSFVFPKSELASKRNQFGYFEEIFWNCKYHPIEKFANDNDISLRPINQKFQESQPIVLSGAEAFNSVRKGQKTIFKNPGMHKNFLISLFPSEKILEDA